MSLILTGTGFDGLYVIETGVYKDERGCFFETYSEKKLNDLGIGIRFVQDNVSRSKSGVLRGLHYQLEPASQTKLLTVVSGSILDVAADVRTGSPTFGKHFRTVMNAGDGRSLLIPKGFAHGFLALSDDTVVIYKCDSPYSPAHERGIRFDDPGLGIDWGTDNDELTVTERDRNFPCLKDAEINFRYKG